MTGAYTPREGSKGDLAWQHVKAFGLTAAMDLADAIDADAKNLQNNIVLTLRHGLIVRRKVDGRTFYDLGDGTPWEPEPNTEAAPAGPARNGSQTPDGAAAIPGARAGSDPKGRDSQHVLKAEPERADATDRETPADASPRVGATGAGQAADAAAVAVRIPKDTPQKGANRDASTGQSHGAGESESSPGGGTVGAPALGAAPAFLRKARKVKPPRTAGKKPAKAKPAPLPAGTRAYVKAIEQRLPPDPPPGRADAHTAAAAVSLRSIQRRHVRAGEERSVHRA